MKKYEIWFTSDTHFSHERIIEYCERPFADVEEMNKQLVANWNERVKDGDVVIHCGDVAMGRPQDTRSSIEALNGRKILIRGNHDSKRYLKMYRELGWRVFDSIVVNDTLIRHHYLSDAELEEEFSYSRVIHGHAHGSHVQVGHFDVGVDAVSFKRRDWYGPLHVTYIMSRDDEFALRAFLNKLLG